LHPVLYGGKTWARDFFQWFKRADGLDLLMVPESYVSSRLDREVLSVRISTLDELHGLKKVPLNKAGLSIRAHLEPFRIRFTTNTVGVPHLIKVSYFPNWKVTGAEGVYPVSPHLMLVIPREKEVVLTYGRSLWDYVGMVITAGTLLFLLLVGLTKVKRWRLVKIASNPPSPYLSPPPLPASGGRPSPVMGEGILEKGAGRTRSALIALVLLAAAGLIIAGAILRNKPVRTYVNGYKHYQLGNQLLDAKYAVEANRSFRTAIETMAPMVKDRHSYDHQDVIHCMLFTAMSLERLGDWGKAETVYKTILQDYPYSRYAGECYVKIARGKKVGRDPSLEEALKLLERGDQAQALPSLKKTLDQTELSLAFLRRAMVEDPYSVWAKYAAQDLEAEQHYLKPKLPLMRALCDDVDARRSLSSLCSENPFDFQKP
jgi:hypothetical protein